jgi:hypothetical protein
MIKSRNEKPNFSMTSCSKTGIKIKNNGNDYKCDPFEGVVPFKNVKSQDRVDLTYNQKQYEELDLNIENYSREELYGLFGFKALAILSEENMKEAKKIVLKTHPDKSRLENKYFIFFKKAYHKLFTIYEFQNKSTKKTTDTNEHYDSENKQILDKMFNIKKDLKNSDNFNNWFNEQFEKHKLEDPIEHGYDEWLKSDEDIIFTPQNISKTSISKEIDKIKKGIQILAPYKGVGDTFVPSSIGGSSLMEYNSNFSSGSLFCGTGGYTDLRQAYSESVIPVTEDDFHKMKKFKSVNEYKRHRDEIDITPLDKEASLQTLFNQTEDQNNESSARAFYYAQQSEKANKNNAIFWAGLKQLTNLS